MCLLGGFVSQFKRCKDEGVKPHPAHFPVQIPEFFVQFLTDPGDLVVDPFAGSNTTGSACEGLGRRWLAIEQDSDYVAASRFRFFAPEPRSISTDDETQAVLPETPQ
jgi:DNA modification methylase